MINEVKQGLAPQIVGWVTAWELLIPKPFFNSALYRQQTGLIQVKEEGWTGFSEGWQGCSEGFPKGKAQGKSPSIPTLLL